MTPQETKSFIDTILLNKSEEEKVTILRNCLEFHAFQHPWMDEELAACILENIANEYQR